MLRLFGIAELRSANRMNSLDFEVRYLRESSGRFDSASKDLDSALKTCSTSDNLSQPLFNHPDASLAGRRQQTPRPRAVGNRAAHLDSQGGFRR
jgi:hypothetical protein